MQLHINSILMKRDLNQKPTHPSPWVRKNDVSRYISPQSKKYATMTKKAGRQRKCRRCIKKNPKEVQHPVKQRLLPNETWTLLSNQSHLLVTTTSIKRILQTETHYYYAKKMFSSKSLQQVLSETCKRAESHPLMLAQMQVFTVIWKKLSVADWCWVQCPKLADPWLETSTRTSRVTQGQLFCSGSIFGIMNSQSTWTWVRTECSSVFFTD